SLFGHLTPSSSENTKNWGLYPTMQLGKAPSGNPRETVMRFDVSALNGNYSSITAVTLRLHIPSNSAVVVENAGTDRTIVAYRLADANASWLEGVGVGVTPTVT